MVLFFNCTCAPHGDDLLQQAHEVPLPFSGVEPPSVFGQQDPPTRGPADKAQAHDITGSAVDNVAPSTIADVSATEEANLQENQPSLPCETIGRSSGEYLATAVPASAHTDCPTGDSSPPRQSANVSLGITSISW